MSHFSIVILNEKFEISVIPLNLVIVGAHGEPNYFTCTPLQNYMIIGFFYNGFLMNPRVDNLSSYPFTDLEKYLMVETNVRFTFPTTEYRTGGVAIKFFDVDPKAL